MSVPAFRGDKLKLILEEPIVLSVFKSQKLYAREIMAIEGMNAGHSILFGFVTPTSQPPSYRLDAFFRIQDVIKNEE